MSFVCCAKKLKIVDVDFDYEIGTHDFVVYF